MSMYLFDEQPILANKTLAREIGLSFSSSTNKLLDRN